MQHTAHHLWQSLRPVLTGWLVVALMLPTLLALSPNGAMAAVADDVARICSSQTSENHSTDHQNHQQDCPCCLPSSAALNHSALPPRDVVILPALHLRQVQMALVETDAVALKNFQSETVRARGPPQLLHV